MPRDVSNVYRIEGYDEVSGVGDLALLQLDESINDIEPVAILDGVPTDVALTVSRYGYGQTTPGGQSDHRLRVSTEGLWAWEDRINGNVTGACGELGPRWSEYGALFTRDIGSGHSMDGDSGGPVVIEGGIWALAGVTSGRIHPIPCNIEGHASSNEVGVSNRVDTKSGSFYWLQSYVPDVKTISLSNV